MENGRIYFDKILHKNCCLFKKTKRTQTKVENFEKIPEILFPNMSLLEIMAQTMNVTKTEFGSFVAILLKPNDLLSITYWWIITDESLNVNETEWKWMKKASYNVIIFRLSKCLAIADREVDHWDDDHTQDRDREIDRDLLIKLGNHVYFIFQKKRKDANSVGVNANSPTTNMIMKIGTKMVSFREILEHHMIDF